MKKPIVRKKDHKLLLSASIKRMMAVFFTWPELEFTLSELALTAEVSKSTASELLPVLENAGIITKIQKGPIFRLRANVDEFAYLKRKISYNLEMLYESGLVEMLLQKFQNVHSISLFGSYRFGQDISTSDVDIALEVTEEDPFKIIHLEDTGIEGFLSRKVNLHFFNRKKIDINLFNNIVNGIAIYGFIEVSR